MKNLLITTILLLSAIIVFSQNNYQIEFTYDAAGNRTERHVIEFKEPDKSMEQRAGGLEQGVGSIEYKSIDEPVYKDKLGDIEVSIFPNPTKGELVIRHTNEHGAGAQGSGQTNGRIEVFTLTGERVIQKDNIAVETTLDISKLPKGTYVLKILLDEHCSTWKIVKE